MSSLSTTAEEILELCGRGAVHSDPKVARAILLTDIENLLERSVVVAELRKETERLDYENRQLERTISILEGQLEDLEEAAS